MCHPTRPYEAARQNETNTLRSGTIPLNCAYTQRQNLTVQAKMER